MNINEAIEMEKDLPKIYRDVKCKIDRLFNDMDKNIKNNNFILAKQQLNQVMMLKKAYESINIKLKLT